MWFKAKPISAYILDNPHWVYQSNKIDVQPLDPALQAPARIAKKWWSWAPSTSSYWWASGHRVDAQTRSFLLFIPLPKNEREIISLMGGKVARRVYRSHEILTFFPEQLHVVWVRQGWLLSPSIALLEKSLDGTSAEFNAMPLHTKFSGETLYLGEAGGLPSLNVSPWTESGVYFFREGKTQADRHAPSFLGKWRGQIPSKIDSWSVVPDQVTQLDFWQISSPESWAKSHPDWPETWHFLLNKTEIECWQFHPKGETPIFWLPIEDPEAISFLSGGQTSQAGIFPLVLPLFAQKLVSEHIPSHHYFTAIAGGLAFSETVSALQWYLTQHASGTPAAQSQRFQREILPVLLPRQSRFTLTLPSEGPSYFLWEGMGPAPDKQAMRFSWGKPLARAKHPSWVLQGHSSPPTPDSLATIKQDQMGFWWVKNQRTNFQSPPQSFSWATWHPHWGIWVGNSAKQEIYHVGTNRSFPFSGDSKLVGFVQQKNGQTMVLTQFGQLIPLDAQMGLLPAKSLQLERIGRQTRFQVVQAANLETLIVRVDPTGLTWFGPSGEKWATRPIPFHPWKSLTYEVLPNNLRLVVLFDGHSHYLYSQDGTWLGQRGIPGKGPLRVQYAASYRKLMVYSQQDNSWDLWALGPIDD